MRQGEPGDTAVPVSIGRNQSLVPFHSARTNGSVGVVGIADKVV